MGKDFDPYTCCLHNGRSTVDMFCVVLYVYLVYLRFIIFNFNVYVITSNSRTTII